MGQKKRPNTSAPNVEQPGPSVASSSSKSGKRKREQVVPESIQSVSVTSATSHPKRKDSERRSRKKERNERDKRTERIPQQSLDSTGHLEHDIDQDMTIIPIFTTATGKIVHNQNAGFFLTEYLQSFNRDPNTFVASFDVKLIPPDDLAERKWTRDPNNPHQPPPGSLYSCTVTLPAGLKLRTATSETPGQRSKTLAKQNAMGMMVKALVEAGEMSQDLEPRPTGDMRRPKQVKNSDLRDMEWFERQERLGRSTTASDDSQSRHSTLNERWAAFKEGIKDQLPPAPTTTDGRKGHLETNTILSPGFWDDCPSFAAGVELYPIPIELDVPSCTDECRTICLITTRPIPETDKSFGINLSVPAANGREEVIARAKLVARPKLSKLDDQQLKGALVFTQRVLREQMAQPFHSDLAKTRWLVLPMQRDYVAGKHSKIKRKHFDWEQVKACQEPLPIAFDLATISSSSSLEVIRDTIYTVTAEYAQRQCIILARTDLKGLSPHPDYPGRTIAQDQAYHKDNSPVPRLEYPDQPVFECSVATPGRHGGFPAEVWANEGRTRFALPELGARCALSASVYRTTSILPTLVGKLDDLLVARQLSQTLFAGNIDTSLALQAMTAPMSTHHLKDSYERLEILGDTLLKLIATVDLYIRPRDPGFDEESAHQRRHLVLSNRSLQTNAAAAGITPYIRSIKRKPKDWRPRGWAIEGAVDAEAKPRVIGAKTVADAAEALIAASYLSQAKSIDSAISAIRALHVPLQSLIKWADASAFVKAQAKPIPKTKRQDPDDFLSLLPTPKTILFGYTFVDPERAKCILSRAKSEEERLLAMKYKLLGDSLLEYCEVNLPSRQLTTVVTEDLWEQHPSAGPQEITVMKHSRTTDVALSAFCATTPLLDRLTGLTSVTKREYGRYKRKVHAQRDAADKMIDSATQASDSDEGGIEIGKEWWADMSQEHLVGDVAESVLGAILEDCAYDLQITRDIYRQHFAPFFERYCLGPHRDSQHPKSQLSQILGKRHCRHHEMRYDGANDETKELDASVWIHGKKIGRGSALYSELAMRRACAQVMAKIKADPEFVNKICNC